jgi:hypothetical protein
VFWVNVITKIDVSISIGIKIFHNLDRDVIDIFTIPSTITVDNSVWACTEEVFRFWAVFSSPVVFNHNETVVDFTSIKRSIIIHVTMVVNFF